MTYYIGSIPVMSTDVTHHGVTGQQWGVRRWQNPDGTLTPEGRIHYGIGESRKNQTTGEATTKQPRPIKDTDGNTQTTRKQRTARIAVDVLTSVISPAYAVMTIPKIAVSVAAAAKESNYLRHREEHGQIDEKTGLYLKPKEMTEREDCKACNPAFRDYYADDTVNNCALCSAAYEMRRRGYDVIAKRDRFGKNTYDIVKIYKNGKFKDFGVAAIDRVRNAKELNQRYYEARSKKRETMNAFLSEVEKQDNTRGTVNVVWAVGGGHSLAYDVSNGKMRILDCQSGKIYDDPKKILKLGVAFEYMRTDNLQINLPEMKKFVK